MDFPYMQLERLDPPPAIIEVWANQRAPTPVSRRLYGKFTEHLGNNVNHGISAQALDNPGMEPGERLSRNSDTLRAQWRERRRAVGQPELEPVEGVAPYWEPVGEVECSLAPDGVQGTAQRLQARVAGAGIRQVICLPLHRVGAMHLTVWVRGDAPAEVRFAVEDGQGQTLATADLPGITGEWQRREVTLNVPRERVSRGAPVLFTATLPAPGRVDLDQLLLFPADHVGGFDPEVIARLREARLPLLRFPGGNFVSGYHWQNGIGPLEKRPTRPNPAWNNPEYHLVGTDEYLALCKEVGAEPLICVNAGNGTPEEAAAWVEYCNGDVTTQWGAVRARNGHPEPYGVRFWEVGNELWGEWQVGHCSPEEYARRYVAFSKAMLAVDPTLQLIACGHGRAWNAPVLAQKEVPVRSLAVHSLPGNHIPEAADPMAVWMEAMAWPVAYGRELRDLGQQMAAAGFRPRLAITELQLFTNKGRLPNNTNLAEALFLAGVLHTAIREGDLVEMITHSALVNHGGGLGKWREVVYPHPVHLATQLYATTPGRWPVRVRVVGETYDSPGQWLPAVKEVPLLDALAMTDDSGKTLSLLVINRDPRRPLKATLRLHGLEARRARARAIVAPSYLARNEWDRQEVVSLQPRPVSLVGETITHEFAAHSVTEIVIEE